MAAKDKPGKADETTDDDITEVAPNYALKEKIGKDVSMKDVFSPEVVKESQEVIQKTQKDFLKWVENDLQTLEVSFTALAESPATGRNAALEIQKAAFSLKGQSGTFGFDLGSAIAKSLYDFLENDYVEGDENHVLIIRKHIDTLRTIFRKNVIGDGGKLGHEVHNALGTLIRKFEVT